MTKQPASLNHILSHTVQTNNYHVQLIKKLI